MAESNARLSVSEERFALMLANFKLDLFKELTSTYTTVVQFKDLSDEVKESRREIGNRFVEVEGRLRVVEDNQTGDIAVGRTKKRLVDLAFALASACVGALIYLVASGVH